MDEKIKKVIYGAVILVFALFALIIISNLVYMILVPQYSNSYDPYENSENLLKAMNESIFQEKFSSKIEFTKKDKIDAANLSTATGLAKDQICLSVSDEMKENGFEAKNNSEITYSGETLIKVKIAGICATKKEILEKDFFQNYTPLIENNGFNLAESGCSDYCTYEKCCIMMLIKADE